MAKYAEDSPEMIALLAASEAWRVAHDEVRAHWRRVGQRDVFDLDEARPAIERSNEAAARYRALFRSMFGPFTDES